MDEYGFWVYVGPKTGGCEGYREPQWDALIDDMAEAGMNSLVICISCKYKGYKSRLSYLQNDQDPANANIASNNELVRYAIRSAHRRGIKARVQSILNCYAREGFDVPIPENAWIPPYKAFKFDLDSPTIFERAMEQAVEIVELFPEAEGLSVEFEGHAIFYKHRIAPYNAWAAKLNRPAYEDLMKRPPNPRDYPWREIREYTSWRTCECLREIQSAVRAKGFRGDLSTITACNNTNGVVVMETDMELFRQHAHDWTAVTYDYDRWQNRLASTEFNMAYPKRLGLTTYFLARGVMTWGNWEKSWMPISFEDLWRQDFEDALDSGVDGLFLFEADAFTNGPHVDAKFLKQKGFADGFAARGKLLQLGKEMGLSKSSRTSKSAS